MSDNWNNPADFDKAPTVPLNSPTQTPTNPEPEATFKKILKGYSRSLPPKIIDELAQAAAEVYAHPTRDGWCCACDADIAFATHYIKDEPEYQALIKKEALKARLSEAKHLYSIENDVQPPSDRNWGMYRYHFAKRIAALEKQLGSK